VHGRVFHTAFISSFSEFPSILTSLSLDIMTLLKIRSWERFSFESQQQESQARKRPARPARPAFARHEREGVLEQKNE
jgi:hypothetical protein